MKIAIVTLFPEMFSAVTEYGITGRAVEQGLVSVACFNPRDFTSDRHQTVDDRPYGGGPGMVMMAGPLQAAVGAARQWAESHHLGPELKQELGQESGRIRVIYLSPQGQVLTHQAVAEMAAGAGKDGQTTETLILVAGRYEGVDERFLELEVDEEWSIGDYVLSGGELPAMVLMDAVIRQLPGALGHQDSAQQDSFVAGLLDCPHYTRPPEVGGLEVPPVLMSGDHGAIRRWRHQQALGRTEQRRPELLNEQELDDEQRTLLARYRKGLKPE